MNLKRLFCPALAKARFRSVDRAGRGAVWRCCMLFIAETFRKWRFEEKMTLPVLLALSLACQAPAAKSLPAVPIKVEVVKSQTGFQLLRAGKRYFVKGAGGDADRSALISCGGNSIRTWGAENLGDVLDDAQKRGLTVTAGIWLGHREWFDYHDPKKVAEQFQMCRQVVRKYRNHPALLIWAFGNEAEGDGKDAETFKAFNAIAAMAHQEDPNHPTMTVLSEGEEKLLSIQKYCPDIDILGINSYGPGPTLAERYKKSGLDKPYIVTEFGPRGHWEVAKTSWGAPLEITSTAKISEYEQTYRASIAGNPSQCLGSYTFLWGNKVEGTPTWFGMFLSDGTKLAAVDALSSLWADKPITSSCPALLPIEIEGPAERPAGSVIHATARLADSSHEVVRFEWTLMGELSETSENPDARAKRDTYPDAVRTLTDGSVDVKLPDKPGAYRLYLIARGSHGAATANVPLFARPR